jgi:hypothetical protein
MKEKIKKEIRVAIHAQSAVFRIVKYAILVPFFLVLYFWKGGLITMQVLSIGFVVAIIVHFFYRTKTNSWSKSWGGFRPIENE